MHFFYSFLLFFALLFSLAVYFIKLKILRGESLYLRQRLGISLPKRDSGKKSLWIHAVSVGEVLSLQNLIKEIKKKHPSWEINFSTLTNTGYRVAREKIREADHIFFIPFDFSFLVRKFLRGIKPQVLVLVESEFWPNLIKEAKEHSCPVLLVNGRISERSFKRFFRLKFLARKILRNIERFLVQTEKDKERLEKIGLPTARIEVAGNLKTEVNLPQLEEKEILKLKKDLSIPETKKVIVAGSIHRGEEELLFKAFQEAREIKKNVCLILAPRHPEKFNDTEKMSQSFHLTIQKKTRVKPGEKWDVLILDTIGELAQFYALSDAAFIGGSLIPRGGQNLLEPAFYRKPIFFGTYMDNFSALAEEFVRARAARLVQSQEDLAEMFLFGDEESLRAMGRMAKELVSSLQGATDKTIRMIEAYMGKD